MNSRSVLLSVVVLAMSAGVDAQAPRTVYVVPFSHLDFFWGGTREECLARGNRIIAKAVRLAGEHPEFRFLLEDDNFVANYADSHEGSEDLAVFKRLVKAGHIEIAPKWAAIFQGLPDGEVLARNLVYGKRYARSVFGVDPQTDHLGDLPGYTPQYPQILQESDTPYMVMTRMGPSDKALFYWKSPDGSRELVWFSLKGYGWGAHLGLHEELDAKRRAEIDKEVAQVADTTPGPIFMNWGSDLWAPNEKLIENVKRLPHFEFSTPDNYFAKASKTAGLPELSGEIPSSWPNIVASLPHMWPLVIPATNTLREAEEFAAINYSLHYADYPQQTLDFLWKKLIESMDHNHDGQGGKIGDDRKKGYDELAILRGGEILRDMLRNIAERVEIPIPGSTPVVVFNPLGWERDDVVRAHVTLYGDVAPRDLGEYRQGMRLVDEHGTSVPFHVQEYSENISRAVEIVFVARNVPSLGYKTYYLRPASGPESLAPAARFTLDRDNDLKEPRRPLGSDIMENDSYRVTVDKATGRVAVFDKTLGRDVVQAMEIVATEERGGNYVGIEPLSGRTFPTSVDSVAVEENNAVRAVIRISGHTIDIPVTQRIVLYKDSKRVEVENTVEWKHPRYVRLEQLFPVAASGVEIQYGVPFGSNAAGNILPNSGPHQVDEIKKDSWLSARQIHDWIFAGVPDWGVTLASDHQFVRLDGATIRAEMVRGTRFTSVKVVRGDQIGSLQYPPPGTYQFHYSLSSGSGDWRANKSYQAGMAFNHPLLPVSVVDDISHKSLPPTHSFLPLKADGLVLSAVKKADTGGGIVLRFFETTGRTVTTPVSFLGKEHSFREVNLLEEDRGGAAQQSLTLRPYQIKTIRLQNEQ
ncbi:MAG: glycosyl hydrolase-related protein [Bryobacteraceae bacterium]